MSLEYHDGTERDYDPSYVGPQKGPASHARLIAQWKQFVREKLDNWPTDKGIKSLHDEIFANCDCPICASVAQPGEERGTCNTQVAGSSPAAGPTRPEGAIDRGDSYFP